MSTWRVLGCALALVWATPAMANSGSAPPTVAAALAEKQALASTRLQTDSLTTGGGQRASGVTLVLT